VVIRHDHAEYIRRTANVNSALRRAADSDYYARACSTLFVRIREHPSSPGKRVRFSPDDDLSSRSGRKRGDFEMRVKQNTVRDNGVQLSLSLSRTRSARVVLALLPASVVFPVVRFSFPVRPPRFLLPVKVRVIYGDTRV